MRPSGLHCAPKTGPGAGEHGNGRPDPSAGVRHGRLGQYNDIDIDIGVGVGIGIGGAQGIDSSRHGIEIALAVPVQEPFPSPFDHNGTHIRVPAALPYRQGSGLLLDQRHGGFDGAGQGGDHSHTRHPRRSGCHRSINPHHRHTRRCGACFRDRAQGRAGAQHRGRPLAHGLGERFDQRRRHGVGPFLDRPVQQINPNDVEQLHTWVVTVA